ncbi:hypothetical protein ACFQX4_05245 [Roseomonas sp. GCM10028921]
MPIVAAGTMPATILENNRAGDWSATLSPSGVSGVTNVAVTGAGASVFQASLDGAGRVIVTPVGALDREAYAPGADPVLGFDLSVLAGGTWQAVEGSWNVTLLGVDDMPPANLRFSSGGAVLKTDIGAMIGDLVADDPDSIAARLEYRVL